MLQSWFLRYPFFPPPKQPKQKKARDSVRVKTKKYCTWAIEVPATGNIIDVSLNGHQDPSLRRGSIKGFQLLRGVFPEDEGGLLWTGGWRWRGGRGGEVVVGDVAQDGGEDPVHGVSE